VKTDLEIARECELQPINRIAAAAGLQEHEYIPYGRYMAKVPLGIFGRLNDNPCGKLILVTAMTPTAMGEGKTTTTIGLGQALHALGKKTFIAVREPSLGPCMGLKGGATGGGYSQVLPMEDINLHFTGDLHAVSAAHNLLAAVIDNHLHQQGSPALNPRDITWKRVIDMNDRSLRSIITGLGDQGRNGVMREDGFEITAASEIMAVLCLARDMIDLKQKIGDILIGYDGLKKPVFVRDIGVEGAMAALLKHALNPNLVQSMEGTPVFIHGGPFANIAHGCNSLIATRMALRLAEFTVTEAGFGADLGAEKFFDIKCRLGGLTPHAAVLVVTNRAFKLHGADNIAKHVDSLKQFGVPVIISVNRFASDSEPELKYLRDACAGLGVEACITDFRESGGRGGLELAEKTAALCSGRSHFKPLYGLELEIEEKIERIARSIYGAAHVEYSAAALKDVKRIRDLGFSGLPVCMAKTQSSLSDNPKLMGRPENFTISVSGAKVSAGAGYVVIYTGKIMTMPGLPKQPAALGIDIDEQGKITGLF